MKKRSSSNLCQNRTKDVTEHVLGLMYSETVWKYYVHSVEITEFSVTLILREIKVDESRVKTSAQKHILKVWILIFINFCTF